VNDFVKYITGGLIDFHEIYRQKAQNMKYDDKNLSHSLNKNQKLLVDYTLEDHNSLKFWNLVEHNSDKGKDDKASVAPETVSKE
jgi:hypothetical protein